MDDFPRLLLGIVSCKPDTYQCPQIGKYVVVYNSIIILQDIEHLFLLAFAALRDLEGNRHRI